MNSNKCRVMVSGWEGTGATIETVENFCYLGSYIAIHYLHCELWPRSQFANRQSSWRFLKTRQITEEQENQFASENKSLWSTSPLHVAQQCRAVVSLSHINEKTRSSTPQMATKYPGYFLEGQSNKWESQRGNCTSKDGRHYQMQTSEMAWTAFTNGSP